MLFYRVSIGDILKFTVGATHDVNIIRESQVGDKSSTDGDRGVVAMESLMNKEETPTDALKKSSCCPLRIT
ncbi:hypothetical protein DPMN_094499 [Dreissena polymorpha]|uniref:Uncharacterized protein n=1 Tax=Dreissena polymorpha TaxID=45954 RepID=A0A9D4L5V1_DREPO|nr:hypothetical protein DPMN_094499 [Dreissena polymorpha]